MNRIVVTSRIGADGILTLAVPIGKADADREVHVTIDPAEPASISAEEWRRRIFELAGKWEGKFERPEQGEFERREPLS